MHCTSQCNHAYNVDWEIFAIKIFSSVNKMNKMTKIKYRKKLQCTYALCCRTTEQQNAFNAKLFLKCELFITQKFPDLR